MKEVKATNEFIRYEERDGRPCVYVLKHANGRPVRAIDYLLSEELAAHPPQLKRGDIVHLVFNPEPGNDGVDVIAMTKIDPPPTAQTTPDPDPP